MYKCIAVLLLVGAASCSNSNPPEQQNLTTVDSNVAGTPDSIPATLYLDTNREGSSFSIAMDSAGPTISSRDTGYSDNR